MADTNDGDIKAEIGVVCYLARKVNKAQKELESEEEFKFTRLEYAAIYANGNETPTVWAGPVPALYLWESRLTCGLLRGDQSLNHWEREGEGDVVLDDDRITRLSILGHQIHLLRKAKPAVASLPVASTQVREDRSIRSASSHPPSVYRDPSVVAPAKRGDSATDISSATQGAGGSPGLLALAASKRKEVIAADPGADMEPVDAAAPVASSSEPASTSSRAAEMGKPFQISSFMARRKRVNVTVETMHHPNTFNQCVRLLQKHIEGSEFPDGQAPYVCLPEEFAHEIWERVYREVRSHASYTIIHWDDVMKKSGLPVDEDFRANMFARYKAWLMPLKVARTGWYLLIYRNGRIASCSSWELVETEMNSTDLRRSGFELSAAHLRTEGKIELDVSLGGVGDVYRPFYGRSCMVSALDVFLAMTGVATQPDRESLSLHCIRNRKTEICERLEADVKRGALSFWKDFCSDFVPGNTDQEDKEKNQDVTAEDDAESDAATELIDADADEDDDDNDR